MRIISLALLSLVWNLPALISIYWAGQLAYREVSNNWGWFLFAGIVLMLFPLGSVNMLLQEANKEVK